ncbi:hypothetical protein LXL04_003764 [Taraxacum kok-saghyz]
MARLKGWDRLVERFWVKLSRRSLVLSLFVISVAIAKKLESIRAKFFWGGSENEKKMSWIKCDQVLAKREQGGLNGSRVGWELWRLFNSPNALWVRLLKNFYGPNGGFYGGPRAIPGNSPWARVVAASRKLHVVGVILEDTRLAGFTHDLTNHCTRQPLTRSYVSVVNRINECIEDRYSLDSSCSCYILIIHRDSAPLNDYKSISRSDLLILGLTDTLKKEVGNDADPRCLVADRWGLEGWTWRWKRQMMEGRTRSSFMLLSSMLEEVRLSDKVDRWRWNIGTTGDFSVADTRRRIDETVLPNGVLKTRWCSLVPRKVVARQIPTRFALSRKRLDIESLRCSVCGGSTEVPTSFISPKDLFRWVDEAPVSSNKKLVLEAVNDVVHDARVMRKNMLFDSIREFSFLWCNSRNRKLSINWTCLAPIADHSPAAVGPFGRHCPPICSHCCGIALVTAHRSEGFYGVEENDGFQAIHIKKAGTNPLQFLLKFVGFLISSTTGPCVVFDCRFFPLLCSLFQLIESLGIDFVELTELDDCKRWKVYDRIIWSGNYVAKDIELGSRRRFAMD